MSREMPGPHRDLTVAVFVVCVGRVLLLHHRRYGKWLPPGGHVRRGELPDDAATREVCEETGLDVRLVGERALPVLEPRQLVRPRGVQLERIEPGHEHVDLIYLAVPAACDGKAPPEPVQSRESDQIGWFGRQELERLDLTEEIRLWCAKALEELGEARGCGE